tara:strand:- start:107467 stop:107799 length:333 start_codon:yes stop_codon:yes gene_type:complete
MDLNFPHKTLKRMALDKSNTRAARVADHRALLAHAIERQSTSQSARNYVAASQGRPGLQSAAPTTFMDDRMAFFAGRIRSDRNRRMETALFESGCFRPDLVQRKINDMHE